MATCNKIRSLQRRPGPCGKCVISAYQCPPATRIIIGKTKSPKQKTAKRSSARKTKTVTVVRAMAPSRRTKTVKVIGGSQMSSSHKSYEAYRQALINPFVKAACGARLPGPYRYPTIPFRLQTEVSTTSNATTGGLLFLPNPYLSVIDLHRLNGNNTNSFNTATSNLAALNSTSGFGQYCYGISTPAQMKGVLSNFRVTGFGIRVCNTASFSNCQGRIFACKLPCTNNTPPLFAMNQNITSTAFVPNIAGQTAAIIGSPAMRGLDDSVVLGCDQLMDHDLVIVSRPSGPNHQSFHASSNDNVLNSTLGVAYGDEITDSTQTISTVSFSAVNGIGAQEITSCQDLEAIALYWEGVSGVAVSFTIEIIYHIEGVPPLQAFLTGGTGGVTPMPEAPVAPAAGPGVYERIVGSVTNMAGIILDNPETSQRVFESALRLRGAQNYGRASMLALTR